jgi:hypothetical protein
MRDLELGLLQAGKKTFDEHEHLGDSEIDQEDAQRNFANHTHTEQNHEMIEKSAFWEDAQHWAAFAVYGV